MKAFDILCLSGSVCYSAVFCFCFPKYILMYTMCTYAWCQCNDHIAHTACIGALSICSVFGGNMWSIEVAETRGKPPYDLATTYIPHANTWTWTPDMSDCWSNELKGLTVLVPPQPFIFLVAKSKAIYWLSSKKSMVHFIIDRSEFQCIFIKITDNWVN